VDAHALVVAGRGAPGVADQLEVGVRVPGEGVVVEVLGGADRGQQLVEQPVGDVTEPVDPVEGGAAQLGLGLGPLVGALQPPVAGLAGAGDVRGELGADVQLVAPVAAAAGEFVAGAGELRLSIDSRSASGREKNARAAESSRSVSAAVMPWPVSWKKPTSRAARCRASRSTRERSIRGSCCSDMASPWGCGAEEGGPGSDGSATGHARHAEEVHVTAGNQHDHAMSIPRELLRRVVT
jgi:hypothetical protein